jgi:ribosomal protein S21
MAINMALKRARKAAHRKAVLTERRRAEAFDSSRAERVRIAAKSAIRQCLLGDGLFVTGLGTLFLVRGLPNGQFAMASFLLDVLCLGIKDVGLKTAGSDEIDMYLAVMEQADPLSAVEPAYARKLLGDLAVWSQKLGFAPHRDFAAIEPIFGDVSAAACDVTFQFGRDGKPFYMPGPFDTPAIVGRRIEQLRAQLGDGGFDYMIAVD